MEHAHLTAGAICSHRVATITIIALAGPCCVATPAAVGSTLRSRGDAEGSVRLAAAHAQRGVMQLQVVAPPDDWGRRTGAQVPFVVGP